MPIAELFAASLQFFHGHDGGMHGLWGWGMGVLGMLLWVGVLALVVVLVWRLLDAGGRDRGPEKESPLEILKRRYASGEIDEEEFQRKKRELS